MAVGRLPAPGTGALRCILCFMVDPRSAFLVALSFYCLLSVAGIAADIQVNSPDHNVPDQGNFTTQNEPSLAVAGSLVVVGYNSTKQKGSNLNAYAYSRDGGVTFTDRGLLPANGNKLGCD